MMSRNPERWKGMRYPDSNLVSLLFKYVPIRSGFAVDVGCSAGRHLKLLNEIGFDSVGIEPSPEEATMARQNGLSVVCAGMEAYEPDRSLDLLIAWGVTPLAFVDFTAQAVRLGARYVVCDWRTRENSFCKFPDTEHHADGTLTIHRTGHILDGLHYRCHDPHGCVIPGYERLHLQTVRIIADEVNEWHQTVFRKRQVT